ncbi:potassium channel family protein [Thermococcus henrietii]|uniref:potassium channel family protein n=1 Tax=Thermococcus henrietii TaxID=2016361 RepID=UPI000C083ADE|nr:potassium channel family protein [Thermococcus henrietii]
MCKMAHFGNCDPETADQEYCIFHKPDKSERDINIFWWKFFSKFKPKIEEREIDGNKQKVLVFENPVDAKGFVFPEVPSKPTWMPGGWKFCNRGYNSECIDFKGAVFKDNVSFYHAMFGGAISFEHATFEKFACFNEVKFAKSVSFESVNFGGDISYHKKEIDIISRDNLCPKLIKEVNPEKHKYIGPVPITSFVDSVFNGKVSFKGARFHEGVWFKECRFKHIVDFTHVVFESNVKFSNSIFERYVTFVGYVEPIYAESRITSIYRCKEHRFKDLLFFSNCDFRLGIDFLGMLNEKLLFTGSLWGFFTSCFKKYQALSEAARLQRLSFEREGKRNDADKMFIIEMRAKRRMRLEVTESGLLRLLFRIVNFFEWLLADLPSEYGTNWRRILTASGAVIGIMGLVYWILSRFSKKVFLGIPLGTIYTCKHCAVNGIPGFLNALYYSLVTFTTLGYGDMHPTGWLKALSALEALTGAVFMALIVAVIARKWMR